MRYPVLLVRGEDSPILAAETAQRMLAENPNVSFASIPDCGHSITLDRPQGLLDALNVWLPAADTDRVAPAPDGASRMSGDGLGVLMARPDHYSRQHVVDVLRHAGGQTWPRRRRGRCPTRLRSTTLRHGPFSTAFPTTSCRAGSAAVPESGSSLRAFRAWPGPGALSRSGPS